MTAAAINLTFRLLDARPLKAALANSPGLLALIVSSWFFDEVIRHSPGTDPATYRPARVAVKETTTVGWICLPDHPYPPDGTRLQALPAGATTPVPHQLALTRRTLWAAPKSLAGSPPCWTPRPRMAAWC